MEFEQLYRAYLQSAYLYARQISGSEHIAEDITSETFLRAINSIESFRGDCEVRVWLCQIAKNIYCSYLKKNRKSVSLDESGLRDIADPDAFTGEQQQEEARQIRKILHHMPEPYKEIFMWRVFGELSFKEIGELYGKTDNWACVTYHRARKMVRSRLEETGDEK